MDKSRLTMQDVKYSTDQDGPIAGTWVKDWNDALQQVTDDKIKKAMFDALTGKKPETKAEPELDYEPITVDRRRDLDYIEQLSGESRLLLTTLAELVAQGKADFLLLENDEIRDFWKRHCDNLGKRRAKEAHIKRRQELKESALKKLTPEERKALGLK